MICVITLNCSYHYCLGMLGGGGFNYKVIYKINYFIFITNYTRNILPAVNTILIAVQFSLLLNPNVYAFIIVQRANQSVKN